MLWKDIKMARIKKERDKKKVELNLLPLDPNRVPTSLKLPWEIGYEEEEIKVPCLSCNARPTREHLILYKERYNISLVVTLLGAKERADEIEQF